MARAGSETEVYHPSFPLSKYENSVKCYECDQTKSYEDFGWICKCITQDRPQFRGFCMDCWGSGLWTDFEGNDRKEMFKKVPVDHYIKITNAGRTLLDERKKQVELAQTGYYWWYNIFWACVTYAMIRYITDCIFS